MLFLVFLFLQYNISYFSFFRKKKDFHRIFIIYLDVYFGLLKTQKDVFARSKK